ncbi:MAG: translocation/assembly module TamB, partial [Ekhidna sp.]|nr:translocation/assembly module TamB [Ekhidna sp.]
ASIIPTASFLNAKLTISKIRRLLWKVFSGLLFFGSLVLLVVLLVLQLNSVQTILAQEVLMLVSNHTNHEVSLDKVQISWLDEANLKGTLVRDIEGDTLVFANKLQVNYHLWDLITADNLTIEEIASSDLILRLIKYQEGEKLNLTTFLNSLKSDKPKKESKPIKVDHIELVGLNVSLQDRSVDPKPGKLDFANLDFDFSDLILSDFALKGDTIVGSLVELQGKEKNSSFTINDFSTVFRLSNYSLSIDDLNFATPTSQISDSLEFFYNGLDDLASFKDSVSFILHFNETVISKEDLKIITGSNRIKSDITIDGILWGTVGDFNVENTRIGYGESYFVGGLSCFGLPDPKKTFVLADITDSHVLPEDLKPYIGNYTENLRQMGRIDFKGSFAGYLHDFIARGDFVTDQGTVLSDINLKIPDDPTMMSYDGNLELKNVNVGAFLKNEIVQVVNLKAAIKGSGLKPENAAFDLNATVYNSGLYGYVYDTVNANGKFAENFFEGTFSVEDPNCALEGQGQIDFRGEKEILNLNVHIEEINADTLNFTNSGLSASAFIDVEVEDLSLNDFEGNLSIDNAEIAFDGKEVVFDSLRFIAALRNDLRLLELSMPGINASVSGFFDISDALNDIKLMSQDYASRLMLHGDSIIGDKSGKNYRLDVIAELIDINPYLDSLKLPIEISKNTLVEGTFRQSKYANVSLYTESDSISVGGNTLLYPVLEINGSEDIVSKSLLTNFILQSSRQRVKGVPDTEGLLLEGVWSDDKIDVTTIVSQPETDSRLRLSSELAISKDSLVLVMKPSDMVILGDVWDFRTTNNIILKSDRIEINDFEMHDATESIAFEGVYADSIPTSLTFLASNLNMNKVELFTQSNVGGFLDGDFQIFRDSKVEPFRFDGGFLLRDLTYDDLVVGDLQGTSNWNPQQRSIYMKVDVKREDVNTIDVDGHYYPGKDESLDFAITFEQADLSMGQPFLKENFSNVAGYANGKLKLTGNPEDPKVLGDCRVEKGTVLINYLNTLYNYNGQINFEDESIRFSRFDLTDRKGSRASVLGSIKHNEFKNMLLDVEINANNFEFLNTTAVDNDLYYGSAYGSGKINVTGPLNDLSIAANIRTDQNTKFFVPISDGTSSSTQEFINFVDFSDTTSLLTEEEDFQISGLTLDFDIEVTPDAYCELIFDIKTGDIIRGRGRGNLKLRLNTDGEFNMFGPLEITEGAYNFTVPNFINKEFQVVSGSRITWYGDPYNAILELDASYLQRASFEELQVEQDQEELNNKVPILVVLRLTGGLLSPEINFDLQMENPADATDENLSILSRIAADEQDLKRQVISLLFLKRFASEQFRLSGGGSVGNSVSEFLSSQVSYLVSQLDENLEIEVDLADLNRDAFNTFQLRFAYTFLNGRLKVTRGGDFGSEDDNNENVFNDIVGDWSVEYSLTKDGRLRAKAFRNTSQRIPGQENQQNQETGISLRFVHSFDDLRELLSLKRDEAIRRKQEEEEIDDSTESSTPADTGLK